LRIDKSNFPCCSRFNDLAQRLAGFESPWTTTRILWEKVMAEIRPRLSRELWESNPGCRKHTPGWWVFSRRATSCTKRRRSPFDREEDMVGVRCLDRLARNVVR